MGVRALITGGAGFIGSHLADELCRHGHRVRALDALVPQVHGPDRRRPSYLAPDVELVVGDVRDPDAVRRALEGVDVVFHLAALVGVGQSMYEIEGYTSVNAVGTATLLQALVKRPVARLVVASSMSIYGEGLYVGPDGAPFAAATRDLDRLRRRAWDPVGPRGEALRPVPTPESKLPGLDSVYALSKYDQERLSLVVGRAYGIPTVALRCFNAYGPRQALSNPYTGVLAIFAARLACDERPLVFEDGEQRRDFVSVHDVVSAFHAAMTSERAPGRVLNVASGSPRTVREVAQAVAAAVGKPGLEPEITGRHRVGDVRHCFADVTTAKDVLGWAPRVRFEDGVRELAEWLEGQVVRDESLAARAELERRGLAI
jgi:dTDP-L-rhamnose 4-epimerase